MMNYALDALWWRLRRPAVRDLAALLTAPPLWTNACELPVRELLGDAGFHLLLAWDDAPPSDFPAARADERLGFYAERLLAYWLAHAPHARLLAHNLPVRDETGRTLGALDCVAELNGRIYHLELCCKYFGSADGLPENLCGFDRRDTLPRKAAKLTAQLALSQTAAGRVALHAAGINADAVQRAAIVRGMGFSVSGSLRGEICPPNAWTGRLAERLPAAAPDGRWHALPRQNYLAPARVAAAELLPHGVCDVADGLYAQTALRDDGFWHETARVMVRAGTAARAVE